MTTPNDVTAENKDTFPAPQPGPAAPQADPAPMRPATLPSQPAAQEATQPPAAQPVSNGTQAQGPASYDDLKLPDESQAPQGLLDGFKQLAQELGLPPQAAQRLVDWEFAQAQAFGRTQQAKHQELLQGWADASKEMLGARYEQDLALAVRAADQFGGEPLRRLLQETGLGNHPVIVNTFCQIGRATAEDSSLGGKEASGGDKTFAESLYGSN